MTFVDTGLHANIGQRLKAVEQFLEGEETFMANYADGLTDAPLNDLIDTFQRKKKVAGMLCVRPSQSFHMVSMAENNMVEKVTPVSDGGYLMNGGFFIFKHEIFNYIRDGEELVQKPFNRLIRKKQLMAYRYDGFWACMDTFKEREYLEELYTQGCAPWVVWTNQCREPGK